MPKPTTIEVTGVFLGEKFRRDDFVIGTVRLMNGSAEALGLTSPQARQPISIIGNADEGDLQQQVEYRFYGKIDNTHPNAAKYGPQFRFQTFVRATPHSRESVCRYLQECPHIGPGIANQLWAAFNADAVRILRESPDVAAAAVKLLASQSSIPGKSKADMASDKLRELHALESVSIEMMDLLGNQGFPRDTARKCIKDYGNLAPQFISHNPYLLMKYRGIGFAKTDKLYLSLGLPPAKIKRQALCAWYALASDTNGHTWLPLEQAKQGIKAKVGGVDIDPDKAIALAVRAKYIAIRKDSNNQWWAAEYKKAQAEERVREYVLSAMEERSPWDRLIDDSRIDGPIETLSEHQRRRLLTALTGTICILGGSPGTGKTYSAAALLRAIVDICGEGSVGVCAPTGKAAVRLTELMGKYRLPLRARTIHSLLGVESAGDGDGWSLKYNERNKLPFQWLVCDETSMVDVPLMASLLAARGRGTGLLLIGDVHQLPPVGHGAPLRDLIAAGIPYAELTEIRRNAGSVVRACRAIKDGKLFAFDRVEDLDPDNAADNPDGPRNLTLLPAGSPERCIDQMSAALAMIRDRFGMDAVWETQVIVAVNKRSPLCRVTLNDLLQEQLNKTGTRTEGCRYRIDDKCIVLKNSLFRESDRNGGQGDAKSKEFVANGEFNRIIAVQAKYMAAKMLSPERYVAIPRGKMEGDGAGRDSSGSDGEGNADGGSGDGASGDSSGTGSGTSSFDLGYAATCHKMQGSSAPAVIVLLDAYHGATGKYGICDRHWLYTAISRAEKLCFLVGKMSTAQAMIAKVTIDQRKTFLADDIRAERLWGERVWWEEGMEVEAGFDQQQDDQQQTTYLSGTEATTNGSR